MERMSKVIYTSLVALLAAALTGCDVLPGQTPEALQASGTIEAVEVHVAPELGGRVSEVYAQEGQAVHEGDVLAQLDTALVESQRAQAAAALAAAQASYNALKAGPSSDQGQAAIAQAEAELLLAQQAVDDLEDNAALSVAEAQLALANANDALFDAERHLSGVQYPDIEDYQQALDDAQDQLIIAQSQQEINDVGPLGANIQAAQDVVENAQDQLGEVQTAERGCGNCDPDRLNQAQDDLSGALNSLTTLQLEQQNAQIGVNQTVRDAHDAVEDARDDLAAALAGPNARRLAIAQAQVAVAHETVARAQQKLEEMGRGPDPDTLAAAQVRVTAAQAALDAARSGASLEQLEAADAQVQVAQAALDAMDTQIAKMTLVAPTDGVVLSRSIEPGEVATPGAALFVLGRLSDLTITVYVPEDQYGAIDLGQNAAVLVDSFAGEQFSASVVHIADQAEFTPRNVQTTSARKTTVFAVKLSIANEAGRLKPGMPADVNFGSGGA